MKNIFSTQEVFCVLFNYSALVLGMEILSSRWGKGQRAVPSSPYKKTNKQNSELHRDVILRQQNPKKPIATSYLIGQLITREDCVQKTFQVFE